MTLYLTHRPKKFSAVVGQDHVVGSLYAQLQQGKATHAYLLVGPRGTGKTTVARLIARHLNCTGEDKPCNECSCCRSILTGGFHDVVEIDAATNSGVGQIRDLRDRVQFAPMEGSKKVYIVDEAHQLTGAAANALLKTLEEPPDPVVFILATTEEHKMIATIKSRCQVHRFRLLPKVLILKELEQVCQKEGHTIVPEVIELLAEEARGAMRDALSLLDVILNSAERTPAQVRQILGRIDAEQVGDFIDTLVDRDFPLAAGLIDNYLQQGVDMTILRHEVIAWLRGMIHLSYGVSYSHPLVGRMQDQLWAFTPSDLLLGVKIFQEQPTNLRIPQLSVELATLSVCQQMSEVGDF